jgi:hypothetical protein
VSGHGARVAEAEVHILETVRVAEPSASRLDREHREAAWPPHHPVHGHACQKRSAGLGGERARARVRPLESRELFIEESFDHRRESTTRMAPALC